MHELAWPRSTKWDAVQTRAVTYRICCSVIILNCFLICFGAIASASAVANSGRVVDVHTEVLVEVYALLKA